MSVFLSKAVFVDEKKAICHSRWLGKSPKWAIFSQNKVNFEEYIPAYTHTNHGMRHATQKNEVSFAYHERTRASRFIHNVLNGFIHWVQTRAKSNRAKRVSLPNMQIRLDLTFDWLIVTSRPLGTRLSRLRMSSNHPRMRKVIVYIPIRHIHRLLQNQKRYHFFYEIFPRHRDENSEKRQTQFQ